MLSDLKGKSTLDEKKPKIINNSKDEVIKKKGILKASSPSP